MAFQEYGLSDEVLNTLTQFVGGTTVEIQVIKFTSYQNSKVWIFKRKTNIFFLKHSIFLVLGDFVLIIYFRGNFTIYLVICSFCMYCLQSSSLFFRWIHSRDMQERCNMLKENQMAEKQNSGDIEFLDKSLTAALRSFDSYFCRRCLVRSCM